MDLLVRKGKVRGTVNDIDKIIKDIDQVTQSKIDRVCDKIDAELNSCGRELTNSIKTLSQIKPLVDRLAVQVGENAPEHLKVLVQSICQEIMSKVTTSMDNQEEVKRNILDVDKYTDEIDRLTDEIDELTNMIDKLTDAFQR